MMNEDDWLQIIVDTYQKYFDGEVARIVDAGSRDGDSAQWLIDKLDMKDSFEAVCIDARKEAAELIKQKYPRFTVFNTAISDFVGEADFVSFKDTEFLGSSSLVPERAKAYAAKSFIVKVPVTRLDIILEPGDIDILKIDVEGHSVPAILGMGNRMSDVLLAHIETETPERSAWGEKANNLEVMQIMQDLGFSLISISYQWGLSIQDQTWINTKHVRYNGNN
jgi:FkbM family methyltransferase